MYLKKDIDLGMLIQKVKTCTNDVYFISSENDQLNLKSQLSAMLFLVGARYPYLLENGQIIFADPSDIAVMAEYLEPKS